MTKISLFVAVIFSGLLAQASVLQLAAGSQSKESVNISLGGTASVKGVNYDLTTIGSGVRKKYILGPIGTKVYVAQLLVSDPNNYSKSNAVEALKTQKAAALVLSFVTTVPASKVYSSFEDGLVSNEVDTATAEISGFLTAVKNAGEASNGKALTLLFTTNSDGTETLSYEHTNGQLVEVNGTAGFKAKVLSIWLGTPVDGDAGLEELKAELLQ